MNNGIISIAMLSGLFISSAVFAASSPSGQLRIQGEIVGASCTMQNSDQLLQLPLVGADQFIDVNPGEIYTGASAQADINIVCSGYEGDTLTLSFANSNMTDKGVITPTNGAETGVGFQLKVNDTLINGYNTQHTLTGTDGSYVLPITAYYHKVGDIVNKGPVSSAVTYTITHD
ncbi:fimbrial protein [Edwardsiella piscicida]|uniref:fimbrial protein n=2 Tax=Edwardsiella piscicida TaxID=1263550 RepID=UPI0002C11118|nr:fimbrial protein [Edwardsiella piscicida]AGH74234.1 fimbrial chain protein StcA [Edwardsiella piscicida C07-087]EKS7766060.1 fimbrial protein [Edwardsiella piscicida]EKS7780854.1 fimbrial protein [Edwardsiella piscicida]EKS7785002.1 fimbrial protein [Edwardsiella piscicida]EKS7792317.1 fimbrial protein [Edwardsiella piscicida]